MTPVLVTGAAGFIGYHLAARLLAQGRQVIGLDNLNDYYDVTLKEGRLNELRKQSGFAFERIDLADGDAMQRLFAEHRFELVHHMGAQAGVRYSLINPRAYVRSNLDGFINVLEGCRTYGTKHLVFASSSSVYGANTQMPFSTAQHTDHPVSLYAATKKANEVMAHAYAHLYGLPTTGLRFFTVYGPWGRPDMALFLFTRAILAGQPIDVFNNGEMARDFTFVDDIVEAVARVGERVATPDANWDSAAPDPARSNAPFRLYNIGNHTPVKLMRLIEVLENALGKKAEKKMLPMQPGDVPTTFADVDDLMRDVGYAPKTPIETGVQRFVDWYRAHYGV